MVFYRMAKSSMQRIEALHPLIRSVTCGVERAPLMLIGGNSLVSRYCITCSGSFDDIYYKPYWHYFLRGVSTASRPEKLRWEGSSKEILSEKLERALKDCNVDEAWDTYKDFKRLYGFPDRSLVSGLMTKMSYSSDSKWLRKGCNLVLSISEEKSELLQPELLTKLSLALARAHMPVLASKILRLMLEKKVLPLMDTLSLIFLHLVKTETGTLLASNMLIEICDCFQQLNINRSNCVKSRKPDTLIFNLVLDACLRFGSSFKGQQIIELMAQVGVVADAHTIVIIAQIHEMNGMRDELKKFKTHVDQVSDALASHYWKFYDCLLSLHFKFNDIDAASALIRDMYRNLLSYYKQATRKEPQKPYVVSIGSHHLRAGLRLQILPQVLPKDSVLNAESKQEFVLYRNGNLVLSNKTLARLIIGYKRYGRISELSKLLISLYESDQSVYQNLSSDVIYACILMGWLETAHDILEDFQSEGKPPGSNLYRSLLTAYYDRKMFREADTLLKQLRESGLVENLDLELVISGSPAELETKSMLNNKKLPLSGISYAAESVLRELRKEEKMLLFMVNELNSSIYFFMKAKMTADALKTYRKIHEMKIQPTVTTFIHLVSGYSSLELYREITILWGDIKRYREHGNIIINRDLYQLLLLNFLRGGYFERVMEIINLMKENGMYLDKWMYKKEYIKFHKDLYRRLKASDARNEAQSRRIEHVQAFKCWVGIS